MKENNEMKNKEKRWQGRSWIHIRASSRVF